MSVTEVNMDIYFRQISPSIKKVDGVQVFSLDLAQGEEAAAPYELTEDSWTPADCPGMIIVLSLLVGNANSGWDVSPWFMNCGGTLQIVTIWYLNDIPPN